MRARTGMHEPACMHACMLLLLLLLRGCTDIHNPACMHAAAVAEVAATDAACMRACVAACVIDTVHVSADLHVGADPGVENRIFV